MPRDPSLQIQRAYFLCKLNFSLHSLKLVRSRMLTTGTKGRIELWHLNSGFKRSLANGFFASPSVKVWFVGLSDLRNPHIAIEKMCLHITDAYSSHLHLQSSRLLYKTVYPTSRISHRSFPVETRSQAKMIV